MSNLIEITCLEEGVGSKINPFDGNYSPEQYDDFNEDYPPLPAYYSDGLTPLPKGFNGECELVDTVRRTVYENDIFRLVKPGELQALKDLDRELSKCYLSPSAPLKSTDNKEGNMNSVSKEILHTENNPAIEDGVSDNSAIIDELGSSSVSDKYIFEEASKSPSMTRHGYYSRSERTAYLYGAKFGFHLSEQQNAGGKVSVEEVCKILWEETKYNPSLYIAVSDKIRNIK